MWRFTQDKKMYIGDSHHRSPHSDFLYPTSSRSHSNVAVKRKAVLTEILAHFCIPKHLKTIDSQAEWAITIVWLGLAQ